MKVLVLANWGLGLELLKVLHSLGEIEIKMVVTQYERESQDRWHNVVYDFASRQEYKVIVEDSITFSEIEKYIVKEKLDLLITHSFMKKIPENVFNAPKLGGINIHPSLLPKYRGASPTLGALRNKEKKTGLTSHVITKEIDAGDIYYQVEVSIDSEDNRDTIIEKLKKKIPLLITETLKQILAGKKPISQSEEMVSYVPKTKF